MTAYSGCSSVDLTGMSSQVDLGDLRAFIAVAECGAFHEAADQLSISQPALSRRIQKLEETLGVALLGVRPAVWTSRPWAASSCRRHGTCSRISTPLCCQSAKLLSAALARLTSRVFQRPPITSFRRSSKPSTLGIRRSAFGSSMKARTWSCKVCSMAMQSLASNMLGAQEHEITFEPLLRTRLSSLAGKTILWSRRRGRMAGPGALSFHRGRTAKR